ncbi:hypothetical protein [Natronorubrum sp. DTA7]|uniref:hypothetical protein n=1 Tax=Natronorubrum sp. DTA7 TaxID=3447016 RepID=UPI003F824BC0
MPAVRSRHADPGWENVGVVTVQAGRGIIDIKLNECSVEFPKLHDETKDSIDDLL